MDIDNFLRNGDNEKAAQLLSKELTRDFAPSQLARLGDVNALMLKWIMDGTITAENYKDYLGCIQEMVRNGFLK